MKKLFLSMCAAALVAVMSSCGGKVSTMPAEELSGEWNVIAIGDASVQTVPDQPAPFLAFDAVNNQLMGNVSCNNIFGSYMTGAEGQIDLSGLGATRMMCPDMALEDSILKALGEVKKFGQDEAGNLILMNGEGKAVLTLARRDAEFSIASLAGAWNVESIGEIALPDSAEVAYTIEFDSTAGTFTAETGCNNVSGNYSGKYVDVKFSELMSTRMACPDMTVEQAFNTLLPTIKSMSMLFSPETVGFYDAEGNIVMTIARPGAEY